MTDNQIGRRAFLKRTSLAVAGAPLVAAAGARGDAAFPDGEFVDVHTHLTQEWGPKGALSAYGLLRWMDKNNVSQAVVLPLISPEAWFHPLSSAYVLKETEKHRDRLLPFCSIDPRTINLGGYETKRDLLLRYKEAGALGFGEHKPGVRIDDPRNIELFRACAEAELPVLFHLDNHRNTDKPGLPGLAKVLEAVPDGIFIGHAQGWWANISGDVTQEEMQQYPKTKVAPGGALDALMDRYPNIYGDLSAGSGLNAIQRDPEFGREFLVRRADRLLFGTDYLAPGQEVGQLEFYRNADIPEAAREKIFRANTRRLLGLL